MMGKNAVIKGTSYILIHTPDFVIHNGTTQTTERIVNPESEYLTALPSFIRSYEQAVSYPPNQVYLGTITPEDLEDYETPWYDKEVPGAKRFCKRGELMPEDEFIGLIQICDTFDLVVLEKEFVSRVKEKLSAHPLIEEDMLSKLKAGAEQSEILAFVEKEHAEPLYWEGQLVGYIKRAHDVDDNLSAHILLENLAYKASGVLALVHLVQNTGIEKGGIDYVIDCSEEACGDMNQRGGGNFAKAQAETAGLINATGSDTRGFCAGPAHAVIEAAALVKAGAYDNVAVFAGGTTAKLGMNGKDHVKKGMPVLEDVMAGFAVLISRNDGLSPEFNLDMIGRHKVGTGSSPQAVISALVTEPLDGAGLKITDIGKYAAEMQNPDITKPAGAGDVPEANYKMIAALGVKRGEIERTAIADFVKEHGMTGWAPTQGHIPSGVPYLGFAREDILQGKIDQAMIIGKGSLFLGRMTNLFDGVSFILQKNTAEEERKQEGVFANPAGDLPVIGIAAEGTELGMDTIYEGAALAEKKGFKTVVIEGADAHKKMEEMLAKGQINAAVTMHYPFPIGVSTVGRVITPGRGREMFLAATTGTSSADRVEGLVRNAIYGIIAAKASGISDPTVGIANIEGARQAEKALLELKKKGYDIKFAESARSDGGVVMRGNDLLAGSADVMVMDSLTGNLMMKVFSSFTTGGSYESIGYGYGPGIGEGYDRIILIVSRASGSPVIAGAVEYASQLLKNDCLKVARNEFDKANRAGLKDMIDHLKRQRNADEEKKRTPQDMAKCPPKEVAAAEIHGIEVMDIEDAAARLWAEGLYAETGMGCTGPVIMVNEAKEETARKILVKAGFLQM
ncbi:MAG TPA: glycine/sarcosine/betaine reductase complex component C subunit beta [Anaerovoracaceae bacterium]|nr:glycine/sarcosine/betaine reductase complex component C subunit beta [Anaerovoracaceae bacterium]